VKTREGGKRREESDAKDIDCSYAVPQASNLERQL